MKQKNFSRFYRSIQVKQAKVYMLKLPNRIWSSSLCIPGTACDDYLWYFFVCYGSQPGNHFGRNLREFAFALKVNQWTALDILPLSSQSECAKNTISTVLVYDKNKYQIETYKYLRLSNSLKTSEWGIVIRLWERSLNNA